MANMKVTPHTEFTAPILVSVFSMITASSLTISAGSDLKTMSALRTAAMLVGALEFLMNFLKSLLRKRQSNLIMGYLK